MIKIIIIIIIIENKVAEVKPEGGEAGRLDVLRTQHISLPTTSVFALQ